MLEIILNIYLIIENGFVTGFRAKGYEMEGGDESKIDFLKRNSKSDFEKAVKFDAPQNNKGDFLPYDKFAKLEKQGRHFELFEEIFTSFNIPENPLICVTPVQDGKILSEF